MKGILRLLALATLMLAQTTNSFAQCTDIFISEYVEGTGYNKAIELYNPTATAINLSAYQMAQYNNGSSTAGPFTTLSGTIQPYGTFVIVIDRGNSVDAALRAKADLFINPTNTAEVMYFNGNDAIVLRKVSGGAVVDIFGKIGQDPGNAGWGTGSNRTTDHTLVRKPTVTQGVTTSPATFDPTVEWTVYAEDFFDSLGTHVSNCQVPSCSALDLTVTPTHVSCFNAADGSVALSTTGGTGNYTYNATATTGLAPGSYTYIVTDNTTSCADTVTITISQPTAALGVTVTDRDLGCATTNDGQAYADATGGTSPYTYAWSAGTATPTGDSIINLTAGTYSVTVTDANNCTAAGSTQVTGPQVPQQPTAIVGDDNVCQSLVSNPYSVTDVAGETYTWAVSGGGNLIPNGASASITWTAVGTHTISVTASTPACGNAAVQTMQVTVSTVPTAPIITGADTLCLPSTETYGSTFISGASYAWTLSSGGALTPTANAASVVWTSAGTHTLSVTATNQCGTSTAGTLVVRVGNPSVNLGNDTTACGQVNLSVTGFSVYNWSTGATTNQVTITQSASVGLTVTDDLGCQASDVVSVTITPGTLLNLPATANDCDTAVVNAPGGFTTYTWSNGQNTAMGTFTQSGTYTLSATDANGCDVTDDVVVTIFPEPVAGIPATANGCSSVSVTAGGGFGSYEWNDGQTTQTAVFTAAGTYDLTVTDANGCEGYGTVTVTLNANPVADFTFTATDLEVDFTSTGSGATSYAWDFGNGTTSTDQNPSVTYTTEGSYDVTLIVTNTCGSDTLEETVTVTTIGIEDLMGVNGLQLYPNPTNSQLQVSWTATPGTATLEVWNTLGAQVSTVSVDAARASQTLEVTNLASGMYLLRVKIGSESRMVRFVKE